MICYLMVLLGQANPSSDAFGEWIDVALKHSPQIQAELQRQQAQREMVHLAAAWEDPKLKWTYMAESVETRVGPQEQRFGLEQKWVLPKKRAAEKAEARARVEAASATTQAVRAEVLAQVRRVYAQAFFLGQAIQLTQDHLQLLRDLETVIQQRYSVSKARYQDLIQVQLELDQLQVRIEDLQAQKPSLNADIEAALGQAHAWDYPLELPIVARDQMDHWLEMASAQLRETPMRLAAQSELEATQHQLESAQKTGLPDFMFGLEYV
ncbi:MAG: TolC family protein, partial [Acidobacteria bacterium]|nr:TolC family protein [Acidobacteriota bacterium]